MSLFASSLLSEPEIILPREGAKINVKAGYKSRRKQVLRGPYEGSKVQRKALDKGGGD